MAETTVKKTSTAKKTNTTKTVETSQDDIIKQLMAQIEAQNKMMQELQAKVNAQPQTSTIIKSEENFGGKKIKVINLLSCALNLSTEPDGRGRLYSFQKYGDSRMIKFDDLNDIISTYPNATEKGFFYIANKDVVDYFDLTEEYANIYTKEMIDGVIKLENDSDVDLFIGMNDELKHSTALAMANRINVNEQMDYNHLRRIKDECGIDIEAMANELKENFTRRNKDDEE